MYEISSGARLNPSCGVDEPPSGHLESRIVATIPNTSEFLTWLISIIQTNHKEAAGELDLETDAISTKLRVRNGTTVRLEGTTMALGWKKMLIGRLPAVPSFIHMNCSHTCLKLEQGRQHLKESGV